MIKLFLLIAIMMPIFVEAKIKVENDLGTQGNVHVIAEESMQDQINKAMEKFDGAEKKNEFVKSIDEVFKGSVALSECDSNKTIEFEPGITLTKNYYTPDGRVLASAGDKINPLEKIPNISFFPKIVIFNGDVDEQIEFAKNACDKKRCVYFLNKGDSREVYEKHGLDVFPIPKAMIDSVGVKCSLSIVEAKNKNLVVSEYKLTKKDEK